LTPDYATSYLSIALLGFADILVVLTLIGVSRMLQRRNPYGEKLSTYECGIEPLHDSWSPFAIRYYIFALLFVLFDLEAVFLYPWAVIFREMGFTGFIEMMIFITVLLFGLLYAWAKGALEWI
jgi:NADH-quinone oxidoreductase subunit A